MAETSGSINVLLLFIAIANYNEFEKGRLISRSRCHTDWPLIRYTDVLLQYAEALAQTDQIGEAIRLVNKVRTRAHMPVLTEGGSGPCSERKRRHA